MLLKLNHSQTPTPPAIPKLTDVSATYQGLLDRKTALEARQRELQAEIRNFKPIKASERAERAAALANLGSAPPVNAQRDLAEIFQDLEDTKQAVEIVEAMIQAERGAASAAICDQVESEVRRLVADLAAAFIAVNQADLAYRAFAYELTAQDISWVSRFRPLHANWLGAPEGNQSKIADWLHEAANYGMLPKSAIPEHLRR
ncbi:hypothetical protein HHL25_02930 [Rhizobium sp. S-51]|uniref:Uncharacterized protein n=1 Tax=Rhizobium terricola TaxID=2728849 RepID=A0A7Y0ATC2_9HYPH|nr:hypothetical protein [Rhizobium terricola]NML73073.1 hypothetical protein [Rhizobium terricola]